MTKKLIASNRKETASQIDEAAALWAARIDRGPLDGDTQARLDQWLAEDGRREGALARAMAINAHFDRAVALGADYSPDDFSAQDVPLSRINRRTFMLAGGGAIAASTAGLIGYGVIASGAVIGTSKGDLRRVTLAEGSAVTLNTQSRIAPRIEKARREIDLVEGEALFEVTPDRQRPFVVHAGKAQVRVLGTSFTVRRFDDGAVEVTVLEGLVEVRRAEDAAAQLLRAGERTRLRANGSFHQTRPGTAAVERAVGWRQGRLDLQGMTLDQAAAEFARYSDRPIEIANPQIGAMKVTGVFSTSDPAGFARAAATSLGLRAEVTEKGVRLVQP